MPSQVEPKPAVERRERFRAYMRRLNPTDPAHRVIEQGLTLPDLHGALFEKMAVRADLEPGSQQLVVGGVGSGKTTELLLAKKWLEEHGQTVCLYIDVAAETDLSGLNAGALLASFGLHLAVQAGRSIANSLPPQDRDRLGGLWTRFREFAFGKTEQVWVDDDGYYEPCEPEELGQYGDYAASEPGRFVSRTTPGKLSPPFPGLHRDIDTIREPLRDLAAMFTSASIDVVAIFDGLDRVLNAGRFQALVHQDFRLLRELRMAVLAAAPISILFGAGTSVVEPFDRVHHIPALQVTPGKNSKLLSVLAQRGASELMSRSEMQRICRLSGGVLRDLVTLARDAGEAAYLDGSDEVKANHIKAAGEQLGRSYLRGLSPEQIKNLASLAKDKGLDIASKANIELLVTRRVLEYSGTDFRVHPALEPLIDG